MLSGLVGRDESNEGSVSSKIDDGRLADWGELANEEAFNKSRLGHIPPLNHVS